MKTALVLVAVALIVWWVTRLRSGNPSFWRLAAKYPDQAYDLLVASSSWHAFVGDLPPEYRQKVPSSSWDGPFKMVVPKLGGQTVYLFGRVPEYEKSQKEIAAILRHE